MRPKYLVVLISTSNLFLEFSKLLSSVCAQYRYELCTLHRIVATRFSRIRTGLFEAGIVKLISATQRLPYDNRIAFQTDLLTLVADVAYHNARALSHGSLKKAAG